VPKAAPDLPRNLNRFSRTDRLVSKADFALVFAKPAKVSRRYFSLLFRPNSLGFARLGIMISKQQVRLSVARNRLRRVARESFRQHKTSLKAMDMVLILRADCVQLSNQSFREMVDKLWVEPIIARSAG